MGRRANEKRKEGKTRWVENNPGLAIPDKAKGGETFQKKHLCGTASNSIEKREKIEKHPLNVAIGWWLRYSL